MQETKDQIPLWQQLHGAAALLMAVRSGRSMTAELERVPAALRPGVQALGFHALRWLGRADALRQLLASRPPTPEADALLCVALACMLSSTARPENLQPHANVSPDVHDADADADGDADGDAGFMSGNSGFAAHTPAHASLPAAAAASMYAPHTLVDQAVEAAKRHEATRHQASFINGCLRRFLREREALLASTDSRPQAVWNHPQWWIDRLRKDHPAQWQAILHANNTQAPLILRINARKTTPRQYIAALAASGLAAAPVGEHGVILASARPVTSLPGFAEGHFSVQDAAAQLAAPLLLKGLQPSGGRASLHLLDACAAPGGKTAHLLELADAEVTALDIDGVRCERIAHNLERLGLQARIAVADAGRPQDWWKGEQFDGILLDAPCTASGIVRRHPDVRWLRRPGDIAQLAALQARLLEALWPLVRPGGRLLYCTCSVFRAEGENQIQTFVTHHTEAGLMPSPGHLLPQSGSPGSVFPDNLMREHDGFYYAVLEKSST